MIGPPFREGCFFVEKIGFFLFDYSLFSFQEFFIIRNFVALSYITENPTGMTGGVVSSGGLLDEPPVQTKPLISG